MEKTNESDSSFLEKYGAFQAQAAFLVQLTNQYTELQNELGTRFREVKAREDDIGVKEKELELSKSHLLSLKSQIKEHADEINVLSERVREKREACEVTEIRVSEAKDELKLVERCVEEKRRECDLKRKEIEEFEKEVESKRGEIGLIEKLKKEMVREMDSRAKEFRFLEKAMEEWCCRLELKEREIEGLCEKLELRRQEFELRVEEIGVTEKKVEECLNEVVIKEGQLEERAKEFELFASRVKAEHLEKEKHLVSLEESIEQKGKSMEQKGKTLAALEKSLQDHQKSLDSVSYELKLKEGQLEEQARLFEQEQMQYASQTTTEMLERVKHFASLEKSLKERKEHSERQLEEKARELESKQKLFDSLQLEREEQLHSYKNSIQECEKRFNALQKSVQEQKAHLELLCHGIQMEERKLEKKLDFTLDISTYGRTLQSSIAENSNKVELVGGQLSALFDTDEILKLLGMISQNKQTLQKCQTLWFEDKILDIVRSLIERKQLIQAVRFICTFKLNDKFDPVPLLIEFVEDAQKRCNDRLRELKSHVEEDKVVDDRIADLRDVLKCIEDHSVPYPAISIMKAIQGLEKLKGNGKLRQSLSPTVEKQEQTEARKRSSSSLYPTPRAYQLRKRT